MQTDGERKRRRALTFKEARNSSGAKNWYHFTKDTTIFYHSLPVNFTHIKNKLLTLILNPSQF
jgi:hypothetical protein